MVHKAEDGGLGTAAAGETPSAMPPTLPATPLPASRVVEEETQTPSPFAASLAKSLATRNTGSTVHWGNDGFCIDVALRHPTRPDDVTVGVLCDMTRYTLADDPVEWDIFRTGVLESQGWTLQRLWSPVFFRDPKGQVEEVMRAAAKGEA